MLKALMEVDPVRHSSGAEADEKSASQQERCTGKDSIELILDDAIALAGSRFESVAIEHCHAAVPIADQRVLLERWRGDAGGWLAQPEDHGEKSLSHRKLVAFGAVMAGQQPAGATLLQHMKPIAGRRLRDRAQHRLDVAQQQLLQRAVRMHRPAQRGRTHPKRSAGQLYPRGMEWRIVAEDCGDAVHASAAPHADLDRGAVMHRRGDRDQSCGREIDMLHRRETLAEDKRNPPEITPQALEAPRPQRVETAIPGPGGRQSRLPRSPRST